MLFFSALPASVKHKGEAALEPDGGPGQARAASWGAGSGSKEEEPPDQDKTGTQQPAEIQPKAEGVSRTAGEQGLAAGLWGDCGRLRPNWGATGESEGPAGWDSIQLWRMEEEAGHSLMSEYKKMIQKTKAIRNNNKHQVLQFVILSGVT